MSLKQYFSFLGVLSLGVGALFGIGKVHDGLIRRVVVTYADVNRDHRISCDEASRLLERLGYQVALPNGEYKIKIGDKPTVVFGEKNYLVVPRGVLYSLADTNNDGIVSPKEADEFNRRIRGSGVEVGFCYDSSLGNNP